MKEVGVKLKKETTKLDKAVLIYLNNARLIDGKKDEIFQAEEAIRRLKHTH